jgi:glutamate-1-semialdehyde aminotransferase
VVRELEKGEYYRHVQELTLMAVNGLKRVFADAGVPCRITGDVFGIWRGFWTHFTDRAPQNSRDTYGTDLLKLLNFYIGMIGRGIFMSPTGAPSISLAHTKEDIDKMLEAASLVLKDLQSR